MIVIGGRCNSIPSYQHRVPEISIVGTELISIWISFCLLPVQGEIRANNVKHIWGVTLHIYTWKLCQFLTNEDTPFMPSWNVCWSNSHSLSKKARCQMMKGNIPWEYIFSPAVSYPIIPTWRSDWMYSTHKIAFWINIQGDFLTGPPLKSMENLG